MRYGVLGTGSVGRVLAGRLVEVGHEVRMGSRDAANQAAADWAASAGQNASNGTFEDAAAKQLVTVDPVERKQLVFQMERAVAEDVPVLALTLPTRLAIFNKAAFSDWYYTPGGVFGLYPYVLNKHALATGKKVGI
jgi:predicted dinucleotide-binding enzyme